MRKKIVTIASLILSIVLILLLVIRTTYSLIVDVTKEDNTVKPVEKIKINDIVTDEYGEYNSYYYDAISELNITKEEADILINSALLNDVLNEVLNNVIVSRYNNGRKFSNDEIINLISEAIDDDKNISTSLKDRVIIKVREYISSISEYLYGIDTNFVHP